MEVKPDISLRGLQKAVDSWITTTGVRYFSPLTNTAILAEETGEVARIMARKHGDQSFKQGESADLLFWPTSWPICCGLSWLSPIRRE